MSSNDEFDPSRRQFHRFLLAGLAVAALPAAAAIPAWLPIIPPQPTDSPGKIEVLEFFSFGCPHCRDFDPLINAWAEKLPKDVAFKKVPVTFGRAAWVNLSRLYYTLEGLGEQKRLEPAVFEAIHAQHVNLFSEDDVLNWAKQKGLDSRRFGDAFKSFSTETAMARAEQLSRNYKVDGVPTLVIGGRYRVIGEEGKGHQGQLAVADQLIAQMRKEQGKGKR